MLEGVAEQQQLGLDVDPGAPHPLRQPRPADLDPEMLEPDLEKARRADRLAGGGVEDRERHISPSSAASTDAASQRCRASGEELKSSGIHWNGSPSRSRTAWNQSRLVLRRQRLDHHDLALEATAGSPLDRLAVICSPARRISDSETIASSTASPRIRAVLVSAYHGEAAVNGGQLLDRLGPVVADLHVVAPPHPEVVVVIVERLLAVHDRRDVVGRIERLALAAQADELVAQQRAAGVQLNDHVSVVAPPELIGVSERRASASATGRRAPVASR